MRPIFKTELLLYQPQANIDEEILFGKIAYQFDVEIERMLVKSILGMGIPHSVVAYDLHAIEIEILFLFLYQCKILQ